MPASLTLLGSVTFDPIVWGVGGGGRRKVTFIQNNLKLVRLDAHALHGPWAEQENSDAWRARERVSPSVLTADQSSAG